MNDLFPWILETEEPALDRRHDIDRPDFICSFIDEPDVLDWVGPPTRETVSCDGGEPDDPTEEENARLDHREYRAPGTDLGNSTY
jgi:hypothetical protein